MLLHGCISSFPSDPSPVVEMLGRGVTLFSLFEELLGCFPSWLHNFTFSLAV